jgi:ribosomal protein L1
MLGNGPVYTIKVGRTRMKLSQLLKNIQAGVYQLITQILDGKVVKLKHVRQIKIKTYNSPSLPIYCFLTKE